MKVVNTNNNLNFQSQLNISKIQYNKRMWQRLADRFNDHNYSDIFYLTSIENGGVKGQYRTSSFENVVDFTITPDGVDDLLSKSEIEGASFLQIFAIDVMQLSIGTFNYKSLLNTINDFAKLKHVYTVIKDETIEKFNKIIASNNNVFERFNKAYKNKGISFDYPPLNYVRKPITNPNERITRINTVNKRILETNIEINALEKEIQQLSKKSLITRLYNKLTGKEDIRKTIENKINQKYELELTLQVLNDELRYLKSL